MYFNLTGAARSIRKYSWSLQSSKAGERPTTYSSAVAGRPAISLLGPQLINNMRGTNPIAGGGPCIPTSGGGTHILAAPQLPIRAHGGTVPAGVVNAVGIVPANVNTGAKPGQPKRYVIDPASDAADPQVWCRWNTLPLLELFITNLSRAYELDEHSLQFRSVNLLTRSLVKILCRVTLNLNTMDHEEISKKGLAIVRRYELDSNVDSLSLPESHALLRTMTAALQQNVDEDNYIITNAHVQHRVKIGISWLWLP